MTPTQEGKSVIEEFSYWIQTLAHLNPEDYISLCNIIPKELLNKICKENETQGKSDAMTNLTKKCADGIIVKVAEFKEDCEGCQAAERALDGYEELVRFAKKKCAEQEAEIERLAIENKAFRIQYTPERRECETGLVQVLEMSRVAQQLQSRIKELEAEIENLQNVHDIDSGCIVTVGKLQSRIKEQEAEIKRLKKDSEGE